MQLNSAQMQQIFFHFAFTGSAVRLLNINTVLIYHFAFKDVHFSAFPYIPSF